MDNPNKNSSPSEILFEFNEENIRKLKEKYSQQSKDDPKNPIKICMRLIYKAATEKDSDKRSSLSYELSDFLTKPDGMINLFLALIDFDSSSQKITTHNQRFIAISNIITQLPKLCMPYEEYCDKIAQQLKPLITSDNPRYSNLAGIIFKSMLESPHCKDKDVTNILLEPIFNGLKRPKCSYKPHESITAIHNLIQSHLPIKLSMEMFPQLFYALIVLNETPSRLKTPLKLSLVSILNDLQPGVACCLIEETLFHGGHIINQYARKSEEDGISIEMLEESRQLEEFETNHESIENLVLTLLETCNNDLLVLEFFFHFQETMWNAKDDYSGQLSARLIEPLLYQTIQEESTKLDLLNIIATNGQQALDLVSRTLLNYVAFLRCDKRNISLLASLTRQSIRSCLTILEVLSITQNDDNSREILNRKCLPTLKQLREFLNESSSTGPEQTELRTDLDELVIKLENILVESDHQESQDGKNHKIIHEFNTITKDLNDKLVPVRVHALVKLKQMVLANDPHTVSRIPQLWTMIEGSLADPEPYVFLACINLVSEMAVRKTSEMLPKLLELYRKQDLEDQHRLNIGEVIVRLAKQLNETTPFYAQQVLNALFQCCQDPSELMRMSSLTNIGEVSHNLGDSLGKYIIEILGVVKAALDSDTIQVKCAATDLLRTALSGLDSIKVESIQREMKDIYNLLKKTQSRTFDDKLCLQIELALDEIDRLARELMRLNEYDESDKLVKNIKVLSLSSDR